MITQEQAAQFLQAKKEQGATKEEAVKALQNVIAKKTQEQGKVGQGAMADSFFDPDTGLAKKTDEGFFAGLSPAERRAAKKLRSSGYLPEEKEPGILDRMKTRMSDNYKETVEAGTRSREGMNLGEKAATNFRGITAAGATVAAPLTEIGATVGEWAMGKVAEAGENVDRLGTQMAGTISGALSPSKTIEQAQQEIQANKDYTKEKTKEFVGEKAQQAGEWYEKQPQVTKDVLASGANLLDVAEGVPVAGAAATGARIINRVMPRPKPKPILSSEKKINNTGVIKVGNKKVPVEEATKSGGILQRMLKPLPTKAERFFNDTGEQMGDWLVKRGIIENPENTIKKLYERFEKSKSQADSGFNKIKGTYKDKSIDKAVTELLEQERRIAQKGAPSRDKKLIENLSKKNNAEGLTMREINTLKRLYERKVKTEYVKDATKTSEDIQAKTNLDSAIREFQATKAKELGFDDLKEINLETKQTRSVLDAVGERYLRSQTNNAVSLTDWIVATGASVNPKFLGALIGKKVISSDGFKTIMARIMAKRPTIGEPEIKSLEAIERKMKIYEERLKNAKTSSAKQSVKKKMEKEVDEILSTPNTKSATTPDLLQEERTLQNQSSVKDTVPLVKQKIPEMSTPLKKAEDSAILGDDVTKTKMTIDDQAKPVTTPPSKVSKGAMVKLEEEVGGYISNSKADNILEKMKKYTNEKELRKSPDWNLIEERLSVITKKGNNISANEFREMNKLRNIREEAVKSINKKKLETLAEQQYKKDMEIRKNDSSVDKIMRTDENILIKEAKKYKNFEEFLGKIRGSATQYGEYSPKLRKFVSPNSKRLSEFDGFDGEQWVTIYRGIDSKSVTGKKIGTGDFVTTDFDSALAYTDSPSKVVEKRVKAKNLITEFSDEFDIENPFYVGTEFIYVPAEKPITKVTDTKLKEIWQKANSNK